LIIVDTNVISELMRTSVSPNVLEWIDRQIAETIYITTISVAELRFGIASMPDGRRKTLIDGMFETQLLRMFDKRVLPFDLDATNHYARLRTQAKSTGRAINAPDAFIAAIAAQHGYAVATRDVSPFEAAGLVVIDPWQSSAQRSN
jgi:toxin FitB